MTITEDLRVALYQNGDYNMNYNKDRHQIKDWIRHSLDHLLLVYESTDDFPAATSISSATTSMAYAATAMESTAIEHSEQWYQSRIRLPLELLFESINGSKSLRKESFFHFKSCKPRKWAPE